MSEFLHERIPRPKDPRTTRKMMNHAAYRFESMDDLWHAAVVAYTTQTWNGVQVVQNLFDLKRYYDLIVRHRFDIIVETGVFAGGSSMFFMDVLEMLSMHETPYVGIDLDLKYVQKHTFEHSHSHLWIQRDCLAYETVDTVRTLVDGKKCLMVLDSVHTKEHVDEELKLYAPLINTKNSYLVISDSDHSGFPVLADYGPSAHHSVEEFMQENGLGRKLGFEIDKKIELAYGPVTVSPNGWLRKI